MQLTRAAEENAVLWWRLAADYAALHGGSSRPSRAGRCHTAQYEGALPALS